MTEGSKVQSHRSGGYILTHRLSVEAAGRYRHGRFAIVGHGEVEELFIEKTVKQAVFGIPERLGVAGLNTAALMRMLVFLLFSCGNGWAPQG